MATYTLTLTTGESLTLNPPVSSPLESEDLAQAVRDKFNGAYWLDRVNPIFWAVKESRYNEMIGTITRNDSEFFPVVGNDWEAIARINGNILTITFNMLPNRGYWEAPSARDVRKLARNVARTYGRTLSHGVAVERVSHSRGFHALYSLEGN